jgi:hypothetical protein
MLRGVCRKIVFEGLLFLFCAGLAATDSPVS